VTVSNSAISVTANFAKVPMVMGLPRPPEGGTVTGSGLCLPGKSVALRATAAAKWWFMRWSDGVQTAARSVTTAADVTLFAEFKLITQIAKPEITNPGAQNAMVGVAFRLPLQVASECLPTVTVTGLPTGLKFDANALTISGVPSAVPVGGVATVKIAASNPGGKATDVFFQISVVPLAAAAQGTFSGVVFEEGGDVDTVKGVLSTTITPLGAFSAKVTAQTNAASFTGASWDSASNGVFRITLRTVKGETLAVAVNTNWSWSARNLEWSLSGGAFGSAGLIVHAQRNAFLVRTAPGYTAATNTLARYKGYYTVALPAETFSDMGAAGNVPQGSGYLMLTVKDGGAVTLTGKLADGMTLSGAATLIVLDAGTAGEGGYVPLFFPLYSARGVFSGLLLLDPSISASPSDNVATAVDGRLQGWRYPGKAPTAAVPQTEDRFALTLGMIGGYYSPLADLRAYYSNTWFTAGAPSVSNTYIGVKYTTTVDVVHAALPEVPLVFNPSTGAILLPAGKVPVYSNAVPARYVYAPTNPAMATLTATKATGLFTGGFNLYYEYLDQVGALKLKTVGVSHEGVLTPMRADTNAPSGQGFYLVPDTWKSQGAAPVAYPLKRSYGVEILGND
jgi:hypothetical protein